MKTSRQRLFNYIKKKQVTTVKEISATLKMTPANARHHLAILIDQGVVEVTGKLIGRGPGRPHSLYRVIRQGTRDNLKELSITLLKLLMEGKENQERDADFRQIANHLLKGEISQHTQQTKRLNDAIKCLNQMNYEARWEAHHDAPHVILDNCPYAEIVADFPEICRVNEYIIEQLLGNSVTQFSKLEPIKSGLHRCIFIVDTE